MKSILRSASFKILLLTGITVVFNACKGDKDSADAYGNFETDEVIVSAESQGELIQFGIHEGDKVNKGQFLGRIDSTDVSIKKNQLMAQHSVILARIRNLDAQLRVQDEQRANLVREVNRITNLYNDKAATQQQLDDINGKVKVLDSQTEALKSQKSIIAGEQSVLSAQLQEVDNQISKCRIVSPADGTILEKYTDAGELVSPGKALFKLANLNEMELKVYISGSQLSSVSIGDTVNVTIDSESGEMQTIKGIVSWVASQVEFTPKIIQTKQERVNMVYAVKVRVNNDGRLKIGMPGEVRFK
ncbi:MAG TPA: HlyD family efflux transporter periplasmic adaptor subunit [Bacteroidales bacterium]|nr:HlyD family efflux transporter periplasmic adaptor subunit [Bacteroidales bacterium]